MCRILGPIRSRVGVSMVYYWFKMADYESLGMDSNHFHYLRTFPNVHKNCNIPPLIYYRNTLNEQESPKSFLFLYLNLSEIQTLKMICRRVQNNLQSQPF